MNNNQKPNIDQIEIHIRTYRSLLKSSGFVEIEKLIDSHMNMNSFLHEKAKSNELDTATFIYSLLRLPDCMSQTEKIILGQSIRVFKNNSYGHVKDWQAVTAAGRRRKMFFDGKGTLAVYIASVTDVDDLITLMTAFQIEWNKLHKILNKSQNVIKTFQDLVQSDDVARFRKIWGSDYHKFLTAIKYRKVNFHLTLLSGSYMEYSRATQYWWDHIEKSVTDINFIDRPVYFVSSNTHSLINLITRFVLLEEKQLTEYLYKSKQKELINYWQSLSLEKHPVSKEYFLYYLAKKVLKRDLRMQNQKSSQEKKLGIIHIPAKHNLDIDAQIIPVSGLIKSGLDRLLGLNLKPLGTSKSLIINIDYPLGWAAYQILTEIGQNVGQVLGIYIMGKAATLNGQIGDILLPTSVYDLHTKNTYALNNCLSANDFEKIFYGRNILDSQKTVTSKGTYLQSAQMIEQWFRDGFTDIEMEAGPYLNAIYEFIYYNRYEENEFINLSPTPFQLGLAHYASDTPYSKAKNLGTQTLSYEGVEATYAISLAILKKILERELNLL